MCYTKIAFHNCVKPSTLPPSMYKLEGYINLLDPWCIHIKKDNEHMNKWAILVYPFWFVVWGVVLPGVGFVIVHWAWRVSPPPPSVFKYSICALFRDVVHVSEMLCTFPSSCARFPAVVHVSQKLRTFHRSCARFTSPLIMFVLNCIGATKHVLPSPLQYMDVC